jgi:hypothetical protein
MPNGTRSRQSSVDMELNRETLPYRSSDSARVNDEGQLENNPVEILMEEVKEDLKLNRIDAKDALKRGPCTVVPPGLFLLG